MEVNKLDLEDMRRCVFGSVCVCVCVCYNRWLAAVTQLPHAAAAADRINANSCAPTTVWVRPLDSRHAALQAPPQTSSLLGNFPLEFFFLNCSIFVTGPTRDADLKAAVCQYYRWMLRDWSLGMRRPRSLLTLKWLTCLFFVWLEEKRKEKLSGFWRIIPSASSSVPHFVSYLSDRVWMELWFYLSATKRKTADEEGQKSDVLLSRLSRLCLCDTFLFNFLILNLGRSLKRSQIPFPSRLCFVLCFFFSCSTEG